ncbi:G-protein coupled receptor family C group 6 member [Trichinella pseudospiralis]
MSVDLMTVALFHRQEQNREVGFDRSRLLLLACSRTPGVKMQAESAPHRCTECCISSPCRCSQYRKRDDNNYRNQRDDQVAPA